MSAHVKRLSYVSVQILTIGGIIEIKPSTEGFSATYSPSMDRPQIGYGKDIEQAGAQLIKDLRYAVDAVEADVKAFVERNK